MSAQLSLQQYKDSNSLRELLSSREWSFLMNGLMPLSQEWGSYHNGFLIKMGKPVGRRGAEEVMGLYIFMGYIYNVSKYIRYICV
jgi:hypothetical protein